ncbi:MAG: TPM domain-containing protein, partial [Vicinamibacterales bacterium]
MTRAALVAGLAVTLAVASPVRAQDLPRLTAPVNDFAHVIDADSAADMDRHIRALQTASHDTVIVVTVNSFAPDGSIEEYATRLFEHAGIGQKGQDNGVLIVLAVSERRVKIEVGYGLEEFVTDGFSGDTIRQQMLPEFRAGRYGAGLLAGTDHVIRRIAEARGVTLQDVPLPTSRERDSFRIPPIVIVIVIIVIVQIIRRSSGPPFVGRRRWGGPWSGWSGGLGGLGGGGFGGG